MADLFFLFGNDAIESCGLIFESGCEVRELLVFEQGLLHAFVLDFFEFISVEAVHVLELTVFCLNFLVKPSLPIELCLLQFFPQLLHFFLATFLQFLVSLFSIFQSLVEGVLNQFELFILVDHVFVVTSNVGESMLESGDLLLEFGNSVFEEFLLGLGVFGFFLFLGDDSADFGIESFLEVLDSFLVFFLFFFEDFFVHDDLVSKCLFDAFLFFL